MRAHWTVICASRSSVVCEVFAGAPPVVERKRQVVELSLEVGATGVSREDRSAEGLCHDQTFLVTARIAQSIPESLPALTRILFA